MATKGGLKRRIQSACQDLQEAIFSEEATAAPAKRSRRGRSDQIWWAWVGDIKMPRNQGRLEAVLCSLVDLPAGKFGSQTPPDPKYLLKVCPGLA